MMRNGVMMAANGAAAVGRKARPVEAGFKRNVAPALTGMMALLAAVVSLGPVDAAAAVISGTFTGTVHAGTDYTGVFGAANEALDGLSYVETFTYDTSQGLRTTTPTVDLLRANGVMHPVLTYALTINGVTDVLDLSGNTFVQVLNGSDFRLGGQRGATTVFDIAYGPAFANLEHPKSFADTVSGLGSPLPGFAQKVTSSIPNYFMTFETDRVAFVGDDTPSAAPEPAAWGLMLMGFLAVGGAMRARRPSRLDFRGGR